jgi:hypothetical protein
LAAIGWSMCMGAFHSREPPPDALRRGVARQLRVGPALWTKYAEREATRREHLLELQAWLAVSPFGIGQHRASVQALTELAGQTDRGILLAQAIIKMLRH